MREPAVVTRFRELEQELGRVSHLADVMWVRRRVAGLLWLYVLLAIAVMVGLGMVGLRGIWPAVGACLTLVGLLSTTHPLEQRVRTRILERLRVQHREPAVHAQPGGVGVVRADVLHRSGRSV
jgi:hypothetical protein